MQARQPIVIYTFWHENLWCAQLLNGSHLVDHTSILLIFQVSLIGQRFFLGGKKKTWHFLVHPPSFNCHSLKIQRVIHAHLFSPNNSSLMFENPTDRSRFHLKACPWKFPNQHDQVKCTQNNPFIGLRKCSNHKIKKMQTKSIYNMSMVAINEHRQFVAWRYSSNTDVWQEIVKWITWSCSSPPPAAAVVKLVSVARWKPPACRFSLVSATWACTEPILYLMKNQHKTNQKNPRRNESASKSPTFMIAIGKKNTIFVS